MSAAAVATLALLTAAAPLLQLRSHLHPLNASAVSVGGALLRRPDRIRIVVGGSLQSDSPILDYYRGFPPNGVKYITAAGTNPVGDGASIGNFFAQAGINAEWIQIHNPNCEVTTRDPAFVQMVEQADAIYMSGGQSGRVQSCLYGSYDQSGHDPAAGEDTPVLAALRAKSILGGSSAGAMNQPESEILITGHSAESYSAVVSGSVFLRGAGNAFLDTQELVDVHFSERGRQGRLLVLAMETGRDWAFGVDENTAYVWRLSQEYEVVGENGVVIFQSASGSAASQSALMHYLTAGDRINTATGQVTWAPPKVPCPIAPTPGSSFNIFSSTNYRDVAIRISQSPAGTSRDNFHGDPAVQVTFTRTEDTVPMCGPAGEELGAFANLRVEQLQRAPQGKGWAGTAQAASASPPWDLPLDHVWETDK